MPGIPRTMFSPNAPELRPGQEAATLAANQQALLRFAVDLQQQLAEAYKVLSKRSNEMLVSGPLAQRPTAGVQDRIFFATDQAPGARVYYDTGSAWTQP